jgi:hypothetical protein
MEEVDRTIVGPAEDIVAPLKRVDVSLYVSIGDIAKIRLGQMITVAPMRARKKSIRGKVVFIAPEGANPSILQKKTAEKFRDTREVTIRIDRGATGAPNVLPMEARIIL